MVDRGQRSSREVREGLSTSARAGEIANVTGIDQPYEKPAKPDLVLDTANADVATNLKRILELVQSRGWISRG